MKVSHLLIAVAILATGVTTGAAAQRSHVGFRVAYDFDVDEALTGAQVHLPIANRWEFYPSFDYYFVDPGSLIGFNVDVSYRLRSSPLYVGGGLSILDSDGGSDTGLNAFFGLESRTGSVHPNVEMRLKLHDQTRLQLGAGLNFTLF